MVRINNKHRIIIIFILVIIVLVFIKLIDNKNQIEKEKLYDYFHTDNGKYELIEKVCKKNGNWKNYPISNGFRSKYNEKDGFFGNIQFDNISVNSYANSNYYFSDYFHLVMTQGLKKTVYVYSPKYNAGNGEDPGLDDIIIGYEIPITDENGAMLDIRLSFNNDKYKKHNLYSLIDWDGSEKGVATTEHFESKYPHFLNLFIHYSPLSYNKIKFIEEESDLDNNIAIFEVDSILECKKRKYRVKLILDDKLYLDDAEVELLEVKEYEGNDLFITPKLIYINSNWDNLELTDSFRQKYKDVSSLINDIDNINYDIEMKSKTIVRNKEYINTFVDKSMNQVSYRFEFVDDINGKVNDIIVTRIN